MAGALWAGAARADAQEAPGWSAALTYAVDWFASSAPEWEAWSLYHGRLERRFTDGLLALEGGRSRRFGRTDDFGGADLYLDLWPSAYGNLHVQAAPSSTVIPRWDVAGELFQGLSGGWEPSVGYREMRFPDDRVRVVSGSLSRYVGAWLGRIRLVHASRPGIESGNLSIDVFGRRTLRSDTEFVQLSAATGSEAVTLPRGADGSPAVDVRRTRGGVITARLDLTSSVGTAITLGYSSFEGIPGRTTASGALLVRW